MNIIEAIQSGKPFRRKSWKGVGYVYVGKNDSKWNDRTKWDECGLLSILVSDLIAEDWEVEDD